MTGERAVPGMGLSAGFTVGSSGWGPTIDSNFIQLSALAQFTALSYLTQIGSMVTTNGNIYVVPVDSGTDPNKVYVRDNGAWVILTPQDGWLGFLQDEQRFIRYNSANTTWDYTSVYSDGTNGNTLSGNNALTNSNFEYQTAGQSATGVTSATVADTWTATAGSSFNYNVFGYNEGNTLPEGVQSYLSISSSGTPTITLQCTLADCQRFNGRKATFSIYGRVGAGGATLTPSIIQNFGTGGSASVTTTGSLKTMTGSFIRYTWTFSVPSTSAKTIASDSSDKLVLSIAIVLSGTSPNLHLSCSKLEQGAVATPFVRNVPNIEQLLAGFITAARTTGAISLTKGQLKFPAAQNSSSDANTLDDYEEGTWTPSLSLQTPGDLSVTYTLRNAYYTKIGRVVTVSFYVQTASWSFTTASGLFLLSGLPFVPINDANYKVTGSVSPQGLLSASQPVIVIFVAGPSTSATFQLSGSGTAASPATQTNFPSGGGGGNLPIIAGNVTYITDS